MAPTPGPVRKTRTLNDAKLKAKAAFTVESAPTPTPPPWRLIAVIVAVIGGIGLLAWLVPSIKVGDTQSAGCASVMASPDASGKRAACGN